MPPSCYNCPVCKKRFQQGHLGKHLLRYSPNELQPYITNYDRIKSEGEHPEILCDGRTYVICPNTKTAFEKVGGKLEKEHKTCVHKYNNYDIQNISKIETNEYSPMRKDALISLCKAKGIDGYSSKKHDDIVQLLVVNDKQCKSIPPDSVCFINLEEHEPPLKRTCNCADTINALQKELDLYKSWANSLITTMPGHVKHTITEATQHTEATQDTESIKNQLVELDSVKKQEPKPVITKQEPKPVITKPPTKRNAIIIPSKKEKEKGLWCTTCESCNNVAQYATELKACQVCNKMCHRDNDFHGCYHWDCAVCDKKICKECNKAAGGNKLFPFCSTSCKKQHVH